MIWPRSALVLYGLIAYALAQNVATPTTGGSTTTSSGAVPATTTLPPGARAVTLEVPELIQCRFVTFSFDNAPESSKVVSFFVDGATSFVEQFTLDSSYDPLQRGTFAWRVDLPVGLAVHAQLNVVRTNADGSHSPESATSPTLVVKAGANSDCLAQNTGQNTQSILSYASSLDPAFRWSGASAPTSTGSSASSGGGTNVGAIAGATVGGVLAICIVAVCFFWLRHKHRKQRMLLESQSMYGGMSEKVGPAPYNGSMLDYPNAQVPEHMVPVPFDEYGRPLDSVQYSPDGFPLTPGQEPPPQQLHQATAPVGTLPEPMDADEETDRGAQSPARGGMAAEPSDVSSSAGILETPRKPATTSDSANPFTPTTMNQPMSPVGTDGLDDPSSFSPVRQGR